MNVHHVGIAVRDIHAAKKKYELLGYRMEQDMIWDEKRNIRIVFMENGGNRIELIEAADPEQSCAVTGFLAGTKKNVMYHICFETQDIGCEIERLLNARGGVLLEKPDTAPACGNRRVAFLYFAETGIVELLECGEK